MVTEPIIVSQLVRGQLLARSGVGDPARRPLI